MPVSIARRSVRIPDGSGEKLIPNEVVVAPLNHFRAYNLSHANVPADFLGRAYEYLIKQFADDAGAKAVEFFTPPEVVDCLVRVLEPKPGDSVYDPTCGSGGMPVHSADYVKECGREPQEIRYVGQAQIAGGKSTRPRVTATTPTSSTSSRRSPTG
ncbi:MAG: HsdM family class I SAM-dependent methyltransferase [Fimbriiglobus sp.]